MTNRMWHAALCAALLASPAIAPADSTPLATAPVPPSFPAAPRIPLPSEIPPPEAIVFAYPAAGVSVDTSDREAVRVFYRGLYLQSENVAINWTGAYSSCSAGGTDQLYQDAVALRINWFRAMAGIPAAVNLYAPYSLQSQEAALVMSVNSTLSHTPPSTWNCWNQTAYGGAGKSNLSLGEIGPSAVTAYMRDPGSSNYPIGHRRWILYPQTRNMGTGDVPAGTYNGANVAGANALWVTDSNYGVTRPAVRDDFVAWPPKGYVPYPVVFGRWSLSHSNADFTSATVTVSKDGVNVPVSKEALRNPAYGENTIVWLLQGVNDSTVWTKPTADDTYAVTVANVMLNGTPRTFSYNVTVFDPDMPTPNAPQTMVNAPQSASANSAFSANVTPMADATSYQVALYRTISLPGAITPGATPSPWTYVTGPTNAYNPIEAESFHLYHPHYAAQSLTLNKKLYIGENASLSFVSWFTYAAAGQIARVQISLDDGNSWQDIYTEAGSNQTSHTTKSVDLAAYAGRFARLQFVFSYVPRLGGYYNQSNSGWYFSSISLANVSEIREGQTVSVLPAQASVSLSAGTPGSYVLAARTEYQGMYFTDWGPAAPFQVTAATSTTAANFIPGWNLAGNGLGTTIDVASVFGDSAKVSTVWKWISASSTWAFYTPALSDGGAAYATAKGYNFLTSIGPGDGFWVNSKGTFTLQLLGNPLPASTFANSATGNALSPGWSLIAIGDNKTPGEFANVISITPPPAGQVAGSVTTLWAWDAALSNWYFYAPSLANAGTQAAYIASKGYLDFSATNKLLRGDTGFWVNKP